MNKKRVFDPNDRRVYKSNLLAQVFRPGSWTMLQAPSRIGRTLFYPDGRVVKEQ